MSYPRRTRAKSHTQQGTGPDLSFTPISHARHNSSSSAVPGPSTAPVLRKRTSSSTLNTYSRKRASSATAVSFPGPFLFTPSATPVVHPRNSTSNLGSPPPYTPYPLTTKSRSSPHLAQTVSTAAFLAQYTQPRTRLAQGAESSDSESEADPLDEEDDSMIFTAKQLGHTAAFRSRIFPRHSKGITTAPGQLGAGETETEADEPPRHLPTARIVPVSGPLVPPNTLEQVITPLLFEASRMLSIVPAVFGVLYNLFNAWHAPLNGKISPIDYVVSAFWAALTGYQCLCLTTGLFQRWKVYYPPLSTLIRLLALQAICWPATHYSLMIIGHEQRPVVCWAAIGSFTSCSRAIQLWVTSNLWWEAGSGSEGWRLKIGGRWGGRRWDWNEVLIKCGVPMGVCYFVMAWAEALRRELGGC
ncbi:N-glycosylation protein-domain-containing protein [Gloeopeniophorella convolvens]|nr:N-glycosylation protein-domain-containing protein [Gloeopeniophorella convolvens]